MQMSTGNRRLVQFAARNKMIQLASLVVCVCVCLVGHLRSRSYHSKRCDAVWCRGVILGVENPRQSIDTLANDLHEIAYPFDLIHMVHIGQKRHAGPAQLIRIYANIIFTVRTNPIQIDFDDFSPFLVLNPCKWHFIIHTTRVHINVHSSNMIKMHFKYSKLYICDTSLRL